MGGFIRDSRGAGAGAQRRSAGWAGPARPAAQSPASSAPHHPCQLHCHPAESRTCAPLSMKALSGKPFTSMFTYLHSRVQVGGRVSGWMHARRADRVELDRRYCSTLLRCCPAYRSPHAPYAPLGSQHAH